MYHIEFLPKIIRVTRLDEHGSFIHELQPIFLGSSPHHRPTVPTRDHINQLRRELAQPRRIVCRQRRFSDDFALLGWNGSGRKDGVRWIDEEGDEDLADSGLGGVF